MIRSETSRRQFLKLIGISTGGLVVGVPGLSFASTATDGTADGTGYVSAFLQVTPDSNIVFYLPSAEMGQGAIHGLTTLIGEELSTDPSRIQVEFAPVGAAFKNPDIGMQLTGGSTSVSAFYQPLRQAGANAALALRQAASEQLNTPLEQVLLEDGQVVANGTRFPLGDFAERAASRKIPEDAPLKAKKDLQFIGNNQSGRVDATLKSTGQAVFGIDVDNIAGLKRAVLKRCPVAGGRVASVNAEKARSRSDVHAVLPLEHGVAVLADNYWQAARAARDLDIQWDLPELSAFSSADLKATLEAALESDSGKEAFEQTGAVENYDSASGSTISATYFAPYLAHAAMEPLNCTVHIDGDQCTVWTGTQSAEIAQGVVAKVLDIDKENVTIHNTFLGGGFGRRANNDYIAEACLIAQAAGIPVQLVWSREDDMQHDFYRPASLVSFSADVDKNGVVKDYRARRAGPNILPFMMQDGLPGLVPGWLPDKVVHWLGKRSLDVYDADWVVDHSSVEGLAEDYDFPNKQVRHVTVDPGLPCGYWRSVGHSFSGFFKESFIDELAHRASIDPVRFRLQHSVNDKRMHRVITAAAEKGHWRNTRTPGASQGFAAHTSFGTRVAQVAEVTVEDGRIRVNRVVCVVDCGTVVNPDIVEAQVEGSVAFALSAALHGRIDVKDGAVHQSNFHDYPVLRMREMPEIEVHIIDSDEAPSGIGEPAVPPLAAAVGNAVFAATKRRIRTLPMSLSETPVV